MNRERTLQAKLKHPNIVRMQNCFQDPKYIYLVLDYASGVAMLPLFLFLFLFLFLLPSPPLPPRPSLFDSFLRLVEHYLYGIARR